MDNAKVCSFPGCSEVVPDVVKLPWGYPMKQELFCREHLIDCHGLNTQIKPQATIVAAFAAAAQGLTGSTIYQLALEELKRETRRLIAMQSRRFQYLKAAGFVHFDDGVES
jgi:hypothetical protein